MPYLETSSKLAVMFWCNTKCPLGHKTTVGLVGGSWCLFIAIVYDLQSQIENHVIGSLDSTLMVWQLGKVFLHLLSINLSYSQVGVTYEYNQSNL